jgi:3-isopropylmalate/(R)-2-methylmalate dehydratase small subunit
MMQAFTALTGMVAPLDRVNVDTDQIIPKQFLKTIKRTGLREGLFYDWRKQKDVLFESAALPGRDDSPDAR